jgi:hypothetical protein
MKNEPTKTITINFTGTITVSQDELEPLFRSMQVQATLPQAGQDEPPIKRVEVIGQPARLAFSMKEAGDILGVSSASISRLIQRGLLKSSGALRHKLIPRTEIERFLKETSRQVY